MLELLPNTKLLRYRIISKISAGGMGEVYLAEDTELKRKVALKLLFDGLHQNEISLRRFRQEAQAASALNHPNIVTVYEIGSWKDRQFIAMEFVEGHNLRHLIQKQEIKLNEILDIAIQTASALAAAHAVGIVHRDIKPENIVRRPDGLVKVLDFGLAKRTLILSDQTKISTEEATWEQVNTVPGLLLGTAAYMSPEQARGKETDARTDIWSLGVVLYEMIAGRSPFAGETKSDILAAILKTDPPPLSVSAPDAPAELERIVEKCLGKDLKERYQDVKDLLLDLKNFQSEINTTGELKRQNSFSTGANQPKHTDPETLSARLPNKNRWFWLMIPALALLIVLAIWFLRQRRQEPEINLASLSFSQIVSWKSDLGEDISNRAQFSPDGKLIAYVASKNDKNSIWLKQIGGGEPFTRRQDEAEEKSPLWSPTGESIAYFSDRGGRRGIWMAPALGGPPTLLAPVDSWGQLVRWSKDGATIYFEMKQNLYALAVASKQTTKLTNFDEMQAIRRDFNVSPDELKIVYADRKDGQRDLWVADLKGENPVRLTDDAAEDSKPLWHPDKQRVIYNSVRNGVKQIFLAYLTGKPPIQLTFNDSDSSISDISADGGRILYQSAKDDSDLWGVNLDGNREFQLTSDIGVEFWQDASPNGEMIIYQAAPRTGIGDKLFNCQILTRKTFGDGAQTQLAADGFNPQWSPDGKRASFLRFVNGKINLWVTSAAGGDARPLTEEGVFFGGFTLLPYSWLQTQDYQWSAESDSLIFSAERSGVSNIWEAKIEPPVERQLTGNENKNLRFFNPLFSPDGKQIAWLAMSLNDQNKRNWSIWILEDGKMSQIYQSDSVLRLIGWAAEGRGLIIKSIEGGNDAQVLPADVSLFEINAEGSGPPRLISKLKGVYFQNIALSADRKQLAFVARQNASSSIQTMPATGGAAKTVISSSEPRVYFSSLSFAPDGKTIYYGKQANWQIISMIDNFK